MVVCVLIPLLALRAALADDQKRLRQAVALSPPHGGIRAIGEVSPAAARNGVRAGMGLSEALDICPGLGLIEPDPGRASEIHEHVLRRLEGIGAGVESGRDGEAFFDPAGLERLYGGLEPVLGAVSRRLGPEMIVAAAPSRLAAFALARESTGAEAMATRILSSGGTDFLARQPVAILDGRLSGPSGEIRHMLATMVKLGLNQLGDLAALSADDLADRFGPCGSLARDLALGREEPIRPRKPYERVKERLELPEDSTGNHLQGALTILCDRLAGRLRASGISARSLLLEARLTGGGSWSKRISPRQPTASATVLRLLILPVLTQLPRPARTLHLRVLESAASGVDQMEITHEPESTRRIRLNEAARQVRAVVGDSGLMRILETEPESRLPERRMLLTPYSAE